MRSTTRARRCFNALVDRRPAVIARCVGTADVATAFAFAREHELEVAVRGGGHNPAGHCVLDGGLVIDLSQMRDGGHRRRGGDRSRRGRRDLARLRRARRQAFGLVTPGGVVGSTGVCGLDPRRRHRPPDRPVRPDVRQPRRSGSRHSGREPWSSRAPTRTPSCSGGFAARAATSASQRAWTSASIRSIASSAASSPIADNGVRDVLRGFRDLARTVSA